MAMVLSILAAICGLGSLVCFILVVVKMFQHGDSTLGIVSIVLIFCGIGALVAYIVGWMKVGVYGVQNIMLIWTGCFVGAILFNILAAVFGGSAIQLEG
jgi:hypothetical protein